MMPGFGGSDSMDWRKFVDILNEKGFKGPFEMENEAKNSKETGNINAIIQGFKASIFYLSPMLWPLSDQGYQYDQNQYKPLKETAKNNIPLITMEQLL
jgi:hypothetical protein